MFFVNVAIALHTYDDTTNRYKLYPKGKNLNGHPCISQEEARFFLMLASIVDNYDTFSITVKILGVPSLVKSEN